jgi:hypothetical protein
MNGRPAFFVFASGLHSRNTQLSGQRCGHRYIVELVALRNQVVPTPSMFVGRPTDFEPPVNAAIPPEPESSANAQDIPSLTAATNNTEAMNALSDLLIATLLANQY